MILLIETMNYHELILCQQLLKFNFFFQNLKSENLSEPITLDNEYKSENHQIKILSRALLI